MGFALGLGKTTQAKDWGKSALSQSAEKQLWSRCSEKQSAKKRLPASLAERRKIIKDKGVNVSDQTEQKWGVDCKLDLFYNNLLIIKLTVKTNIKIMVKFFSLTDPLSVLQISKWTKLNVSN